MNFENLINELGKNGIEAENITVFKNGCECLGIRVIDPGNPCISPVVYYSPEDTMESIISRILSAKELEPTELEMDCLFDPAYITRNAYISIQKTSTDDGSDAMADIRHSCLHRMESASITSTCKYIFDLIMEDNRCRGTTCEYLLVSCQNDDRMHSCSVDMALDRANNDAGITQRSLHKVRKTFLSRLDMSRQFTVERIREIAGHSRESITLYTNYFYTIEGLDGISECRSYEEVVEFNMPDLGRIDKLNQPLVFRRAV